MSTVFNGINHIEPTVKSKIISQVPATPIQLGTGNLAILAESEGGQPLTVYEYSSDNAGALKQILRGGEGRKFADIAFAPSGQYAGAQKIFFIRTQAGTAGTGTITNSAKDFVLISYDKGAYISDATDGLKWKVIAGTVDSDKRILQLQLDSVIIWQSRETTNTYAAMKTEIEEDASVYGKIIATVTVAGGDEAQTFEATGSFAVFTGGTSTAMSGGNVDSALALIRTKEVDVVYIGSETNTNHAKVVAHCLTEAETPRIAVFGGAVAETKAQAIARGVAINSQKAVLCYPGVYLPSDSGNGNTLYSPMYLACFVAGLIAGLPPQLPATYKTLAIQGFEVNGTDGELDKTGREQLISGGVTYGRFIDGIGFSINKAVTTLQQNTQMINTPSGASREVSIERISNQLNKELEKGSKLLFIGGNANTVNKQDVINYAKGYLKSKVSTSTNDNLLLDFENVTAQLVDDAWHVNYGFYPNTPINQMFITGAILRP